MGNFFSSFFSKFFKKRTRASSEANSASNIPFRLNLIFIIVGVLFAVLIWKLADLQIIQGNYFDSSVSQTNNSTIYGNVQRGRIFDSTGKQIAGNKPVRAITYTKAPGVSPSAMYDIANRLSHFINVSTRNTTTKQIAEYYLASPDNRKNAADLIPGAKKMTPDELQSAEIKKFEQGKIAKKTKALKNAATIYTEMSGAYQLSTTYIKYNKVTNKEIAMVGEHQHEMPGVQVGTNWQTDYPDGKNYQQLVGSVSTNKTGLPADHLHELLAQGYSQNDSVGQSSLEQLYEPVLKGSKSQTQVKMNANNQIIKQVKKYPGQRGDNLQLSINAKFQKDLQKAVKDAQPGGNATGTYAVAMDPNNGSIIGMAGVSRNPKNGKVTQNDMGVINNAITMGSVVKGATVSGALMDNVITPTSSTFTDKPIKNGTTTKSSWFNKHGHENVDLTAPDALEVSSNSYMMQLIMKEAKFNYVPGGQLNMDPNVFNTERGYFNQFGLGVKTGVDLPGETTGLKGPSGFKNIGKALDESYGNYDGYTTMQVAQYISTIANGGYRLKPHVVKNIRGTNSKNDKLGAIKDTIMPQVLNVIPMTQAQKDVVKKGLYQVVHGHSKYKTGGGLASISPEISAKTGTAQTFYNGKETTTLSLASYAPSTHPKVVVALAMTNLPSDAESNNMDLARNIYQAYWKDVQNYNKK